MREWCVNAVTGLGLLLDIVPNHVGISSETSRWWMDVLEHGMASIFANHVGIIAIGWVLEIGLMVLDINWGSQQNHLLVPFLGAPIGTILDNGELKVQWNEKEEVHIYILS